MTEITVQKVTSEEDIKSCVHIRTVVFVEEQNVPIEEEIDGLDPEADQYLLRVDNTPAATARVRYPDNVAKIERVAVLKGNRGLNIGRRLMDFLMKDIKNTPNVKYMKLGAQVQVIPFYEKLGFHSYGDEFLDAGIRHRWMKRDLS